MNIINLVTNKNISKKEIIERLNKQIADFFKRKTNNPKASLFDDIYQWNGKFWAKTSKDDFEKQCMKVLSDYEMSRKDEQDILRNFILNNLIEEENVDKYGRDFFCMQNYIICFKSPSDIDKIKELSGRPCKCLFKKEKNNRIFLFDHKRCKNLHLTHCSNITLKIDYNKITYEKTNISLWNSFLERMIPELELPSQETEDNNNNYLISNELKTETIKWLNEFIFSLITGKDGDAFFVNLLGPAQCGKTTFVNFLINSLGNYSYTLSKEDLIYSKLENTYALYALKDSRLLIYSEASRKPFNASFIKEITGGTKFRYGERSFQIKARLLIDSNYLLQSEAKTDNAFDERYAMIPVGPSIPSKERDTSLEEKLLEARDDIFTWLIYHFEVKSLSIPSPALYYKNLMKFALDPVKVFYKSYFIGVGEIEAMVYCSNFTTAALKEEDVWLAYINYFRTWYNTMLKNYPYFNYSESYVEELLNISQKNLISKLASLHTNISYVRSGNRTMYRFNEIHRRNDTNEVTLYSAYQNEITYAQFIKNFRRNMTTQIYTT